MYNSFYNESLTLLLTIALFWITRGLIKEDLHIINRSDSKDLWSPVWSDDECRYEYTTRQDGKFASYDLYNVYQVDMTWCIKDWCEEQESPDSRCKYTFDTSRGSVWEDVGMWKFRGTCILVDT